MGDYLKKQMNLPKDAHIDCHFTYPEDGKFHYSFKDLNGGVEEYINVFWDHVKIKIINKDARGVSVMTREEFSHTPIYLLGHMVPQFQAPPLGKLENFQLTSIGFNIFNGDYSHVQDDLIKEEDIKLDDLIVDVRAIDKYCVSVNCAFKPFTNKTTYHFYEEGQLFSIAKKVSETATIEIVCNLGLNNQL